VTTIALSESHVYTVDGKIVPGVTDVLAPLTCWDKVNPELLAWHRTRGQHAHRAIELWNDGDLDEEDLDPQLVPFLNGWRKFVKDTGFHVTHGEQKVYHVGLGYAGMLDIRGIMRRVPWLIDLKLGAPQKTWGPQTAAYVDALAVAERPRRRACLRLLDNDYKLFPQNNPRDIAIFQSCLNLKRYANGS
jgi:hypothetical protein